MNIYTGELTIDVKVTAFSLEDALEAIEDEFGAGHYGAVEITNTEVESLQ